MEPNLTNISEEQVKLPWCGFIYTLEPGESKAFSEQVKRALMRRYPNQLKPYKKKKEKDAVNG